MQPRKPLIPHICYSGIFTSLCAFRVPTFWHLGHGFYQDDASECSDIMSSDGELACLPTRGVGTGYLYYASLQNGG